MNCCVCLSDKFSLPLLFFVFKYDSHVSVICNKNILNIPALCVMYCSAARGHIEMDGIGLLPLRTLQFCEPTVIEGGK